MPTPSVGGGGKDIGYKLNVGCASRSEAFIFKADVWLLVSVNATSLFIFYACSEKTIIFSQHWPSYSPVKGQVSPTAEGQMYHKMNFNSMSNLMKAQNLALGGFVYFEGGKKLHALTPLYNYKCCRTHRSFLQEGYVSFISQILPS